MARARLMHIVILLCVAVLIFTVVALLSNNSVNPNTQVASAKITDFYLNGYSNPVGVAWNNAFVLHYINNGTTDVDNATITFNTNSTYKMDREILVFNSTPPHYLAGSNVMGEPYSLGIIKAGEAKEFHAEVINNLADSSKMGGFAFVATLKSNDTILDQATIMIPALG